jgi:hypothetical protein
MLRGPPRQHYAASDKTYGAANSTCTRHVFAGGAMATDRSHADRQIPRRIGGGLIVPRTLGTEHAKMISLARGEEQQPAEGL